MKHTTGASKVHKCKPLRMLCNSAVSAYDHNGRIVISRLDNSNGSVAETIRRIIQACPELQGRKLSFLWTNGTKDQAKEIASAMKGESPTVLENTSSGVRMEKYVKSRLREFDNMNGGHLRDVPDDELWGKMFNLRFANSEIDVIDRRLDKISDILERHDSAVCRKTQDSLKSRIDRLLSPQDRPYYELRRELVAYQRNVSKKYAESVQRDFVILIRKKGERPGTANNAELRTIYRYRNSHDNASGSGRKFVDAVIEI